LVLYCIADRSPDDSVVAWYYRARLHLVDLFGHILNSALTLTVNRPIMTNRRKTEIANWAATTLASYLSSPSLVLDLNIVSGDASFRRYFRATVNGESYIVVDAPPENENSHAFVEVAQLFRAAGVTVPQVISVDYENGFMLLDDFGDELYLGELLRCQQSPGSHSNDQVDSLYLSAIKALIKLQSNVKIKILDPYSQENLYKEMVLFEEWFCGAFLSIPLSVRERELIAATLRFLEGEALAQPIVAVHRDYHSRNLMILDPEKFGEGSSPGIIDFQDAVAGPYTYDLVSLLRDCYIQWSPAQVTTWALQYLSMAKQNGIIADIDKAIFIRHFDMMGLQRHLKVIGIFSRLYIRDKKPRYLADIPLVIAYFLEVGSKYGELAEFIDWFRQDLLPVAGKQLGLDSLCEQ
jgi:aminoglycoside/choline kinase family phosphotransferase